MKRLIPIDELVRIVTEAGLLHQRGFLETSLSHRIARGGDPFGDVSTAMELAASLGIPQETVMAAIEKWYPSVESQLSALAAQDAVATTRAVANTYRVELLRVLREALPSVHFDGALETAHREFDQPNLEVKWRRDYLARIFVVKQAAEPEPRRRGWRRLVAPIRSSEPAEAPRKEVLLATVQVGNDLVAAPGARAPRASGSPLYRGKRLYLVITVGSGVFIKLCSETLTALRRRFEVHNGIATHEVKYDYVVQEDDQL